MKTSFFSISALVALLLVSFTACKKDNQKGSLHFEFDHKWGSSDFALSQTLTHPNGETASFSRLRYYVSNIQLKNDKGELWSQPESYHLIDVAGATTLHIDDVPAGKYTEISFMIGVDSTRNVSGAQTGALSPSNDMFWSWNSGYIFIKAEGTSNEAAGGSFTYHIGGFSGDNNATRTVTSALDNMQLKHKGERELHFMVDVSKIWDNNFRVSATATVHMPGMNAKTVADNFKNGITLDHVH